MNSKADERFVYITTVGDRFYMNYNIMRKRAIKSVRFWLYLLGVFVLINLVMPQNYFTQASLGERLLYWGIMLFLYGNMWFLFTYLLVKFFVIGKRREFHQYWTAIIVVAIAVVVSERVAFYLDLQSLSLITTAKTAYPLSFAMEYLVDLVFVLVLDAVGAVTFARHIYSDLKIGAIDHPWQSLEG